MVTRRKIPNMIPKGQIGFDPTQYLLMYTAGLSVPYQNSLGCNPLRHPFDLNVTKSPKLVCQTFVPAR